MARQSDASELTDLQAVTSVFTKAELTPTENALKLLRAAAQLGAFKAADQHVLSASGLLFAAVELASSDGIEKDEAPSPEVRAFGLIRSAFLGEENQRQSEFQSLIMTDFYGRSPSPWREMAPVSGTHFSDGMSQAVQNFRGGDVIDAVDLIAIALEDPSDFLERRLNNLKIDADQLRSNVLALKASSFGDAHFPFRGDAPSEFEDALGRGQLALFLARRLHLIWCEMNGYPPAPKSGASPADDAMCGKTESARPVGPDTFIVHIDAPWGGGKTTFANFVARALNPCEETLNEQHFLRSVAPVGASPDDLQKFSLDEIFFLHPDADLARAEAERNRWPEKARRPWIVAYYNAWRDQYVQPPWWHIFQTIMAGIESALRVDVSDPFGFHSFTRLLKINLLKLKYQIFNAKMRNQLTLIALVTMLILLGKWVGIFGGLLSFAPGGKDAVDKAISILAIGGFSIATLLSILSQSFAPDLDFTAEHKQIGVRNPIGRFRKAFTTILATIDRPILLIIDDIDRCDPKTVVEVLRGFQTIIRSPRLFVLVLGDRAWIEKAHEIHHKDFTGITVGSENTLGERFVEKIFQLSFTLPAMTPEIKDHFTRIVLGAPADSAVPTQNAVRNGSRHGEVPLQQKRDALSEIERKIDDAKRAPTVGARENLVDIVQRQTEGIAARSGITRAQVAALASKALVEAAASDARYQQQVANVLLGLAASLPSNPRQIKRIINAFAIYETVGRLYFNYRLTASGNKDQSLRWRQLAMWTTLATEWPQTWRELAREPRYVEAAYEKDETARAKFRKELTEGRGDDATTKVDQLLQRLTTDPALSRLLCINGDSTAADNGGKAPAPANLFANVRIDADAIYEFNRIMWEPGFSTRRLPTT
jgi:KAP family P-loop domain